MRECYCDTFLNMAQWVENYHEMVLLLNALCDLFHPIFHYKIMNFAY